MGRIDGYVVFCKKDINKVISTLYDSMTELKSETANSDSRKKNTNFLPRTLVFSESELPLIQGMRCSTAAIAYPAILEQLRSNVGNELDTFDNADQLLKEVIGFKLILDVPSKDCIPDYWVKSEQELNDYAESVLINPEGRIGIKLIENNQLDVFIKHLVDYCKLRNNDKSSTRRAILIVSNEIDLGEIKPLGLVNIWVTPRISSDGKYILGFCFVWRTVEALVGLPYSLFGSIKYAEYIKEELDKQLGYDIQENPNLQIGTLTYIALSLHMKTDDYNMRIAKSIVDAASI